MKEFTKKKQGSKPRDSKTQAACTKVTTVKSKAGLHPKNKHNGRYDFKALVAVSPELESYVIKNPKGDQSIDFSDPIAVKLLNKALLALHYDVREWDIPQGYLCPPIPGRADYIHRAAELISQECSQVKHALIRALDIGVGANCIYPIVGVTGYGWQYVGSDVDPVSVENSQRIADANATLATNIDCRLQSDSRHFFKNVIREGEHYDITTCNPPFHKSLEEAQQGSLRKVNNLAANKKKRGQKVDSRFMATKAELNFGGQKAELWCPGGEASFVKNMAFESREFAKQVLWFTTLISKKENVRWLRKNLEKVGASEVRIVEMSQGQKNSRFVAWTFKGEEERREWLKIKC
ncbi:23S rRNA (adenine(1618)-N(6))-methyltransferase RlmF [Vibrio paucivorans]|uniref:23S rRNA (adenine(1618)-N(6))-methyltransferase RlmF n=1 Tax=Vibrio paucivorans TaxID=2829489 RepID=UPI002435209B